MTLSRRHLLSVGGCAGVLLAAGCSPFERARPTSKATSAFLPGSDFGEPAAVASVATDHVLVLVQLLGGNDGLNTLVPSKGMYRDARPTLALAEDAIVALPGVDDLGLHPALAPLLPLWESGQMAAAVGVGFESQDRSHFRCRDIWWRAADDPTSDGWLARWMELAAADSPEQPMEAIALGAGARALAGAGASAVRDPTDLALAPPGAMTVGEYENVLLDLARVSDTDPQLLVEARAAGPAALSTQKILSDAIDETIGDAYGQRNEPSLGLQLQTAATLIATRSELRVVTVGIEGFDTHVDQLNDHANLLEQLATSLSAFWSSLSEPDRARTLVMTTSEFGRRVTENGSAGTDHGRAGAHLVLGGAVAGARVIGSYGQSADENEDIAITVPTQDLYAEALRWLGGPVGDVLGETPPPTGLLA